MGPYSMGVQKYVFRKGYKVMKAGGLGGGAPQHSRGVWAAVAPQQVERGVWGAAAPQQDKYQNHHY